MNRLPSIKIWMGRFPMPNTQQCIICLFYSELLYLTYAQPFQYKNSEYLSVTFQTSQELIEKFVPVPLIANKDGVIILEIALQKIDFGFEYAYNEMVLSIPVELNCEKSIFHKLLYLDQTNPITDGRQR